MRYGKIAKLLAISYVAGIVLYGIYGGVSAGGLGWAVGDVLLLTYLIVRK